MNGITLSGLLRQAIPACLVLLPALCQAEETHHTATKKEAVPHTASSRPDPVPAVMHTGQGIVNGQPTGPELTPPWIALVKVMVRTKDSNVEFRYRCTGEFITREWVLTARHCVQDLDGVLYTNEKSIGELVVAGGSSIISELKDKIKPVYEIKVLDDETDIALLHLREEYSLPKNFNGTPLYHGDGYISHKDVRVMGFGSTNAARTEITDRLRYGDVDLVPTVLAAKDLFGAEALRLKQKEPNGPYSSPGDSGGPALLRPLRDNKSYEFSKLIGVGSASASTVNQGESNYTRLTPNVLTWISETTNSAIISSPSDEQIIDTSKADAGIKVTLYGGTPAKAYLTSVNALIFKFTNCKFSQGICTLPVAGVKDGSYGVSIVDDKDRILDTVTVRLKHGGKELKIVYPPKPEKNQNRLYTYLPGENAKLYTVSGYATAGTRLRAALELTERNGKDDPNPEPCLDDGENPQSTIIANDQSLWVCNIKVNHKDDTSNYTLTVIHEDDVGKVREVDTVPFQVNTSKDNKSVVTLSVDDYAPYIPAGSYFKVKTNRNDIDDKSTIVMDPIAIGDGNDNQIIRNRSGKDMTIRAYLYRNMASLGGIPYIFIKPDAMKEEKINFVRMGFVLPLQTLQEVKSSLVTKAGLRYYVFTEHIAQENNAPFFHYITDLPDERNPENSMRICILSPDPNPKLKDIWTCRSNEQFNTGKHQIFDVVYGAAGNMGSLSRGTIMRVEESPEFEFPKQSVVDDYIPIDLVDFHKNKVSGFIDSLLYDKIKSINPNFSDDNAGSVIFNPVPKKPDEPDEPQKPNCEIKIIQPPVLKDKDIKTYKYKWECSSQDEMESRIKQGVKYRALVEFNARRVDSIINDTYFEIKPIEPPKNKTPPDGSEVGEGLSPSGTGEPNADIYEFKRPRIGPKNALSYIGDNSTPVCTAKVDQKGNWNCGLIPAPAEDGTYELNTIQKVNNQEAGEDNTTFTVKHESDDNNTDPQSPADPGNSPSGPSVPVGPPVPPPAVPPVVPPNSPPGSKPGQCKVGFIFKTTHCVPPPAGKQCPDGYTYDSAIRSCKGYPVDNNCPGGYLYDVNTKQCSGPAPGGPDFKIIAPQNKSLWDCSYNNSCKVYGQVPAGDSASVTVFEVDKGIKKIISGPYTSEPVGDAPTLWQTHPVTLKAESTLEIIATRIHNGKGVPNVESEQAVQITTPSDTPYAVLWPTMYEDAKSEAQGVIHGTAPTGTRVQVTSDPAAVSCDVVSVQDSWTCPSRALTPGSYTLITRWTDKDGKDTVIPEDVRYFSVGPLPAVSVTSPSDSDIVKNPYYITGTGYPGAKVSVTGMPSGDECADRPIGTDGKWACYAAYPVVNGEWSLRAKQTFSNGLSNTVEQSYRMAGQHPEVLMFTSPAQDAVLTSGTYKIAGTGYLDYVVTVTGMPADSPACNKVAVDNNGHWMCPADYPLVDGHYRLKAVSVPGDGGNPWDAPLTAWRDFSILTPPGAVADITEKKELGGCGYATQITYNCTTVLHLSDAAGKSVPGQSVTLSMSGKLNLKNSSPAMTDERGDISVLSAGTRDHVGRSPSGQLTATSGDVTRDFQVH